MIFTDQNDEVVWQKGELVWAIHPIFYSVWENEGSACLSRKTAQFIFQKYQNHFWGFGATAAISSLIQKQEILREKDQYSWPPH